MVAVSVPDYMHAEQVTAGGTSFWSGPKRPPKVAIFDANNALHLDFILSAANMRAAIYAIPPCRDEALAKGVLRCDELLHCNVIMQAHALQYSWCLFGAVRWCFARMHAHGEGSAFQDGLHCDSAPCAVPEYHRS